MIFNLKEYIEQNRSLIHQHLCLIFDQFDQEKELIRAIRHSLFAGGKRLRPILCLAAADMCKENEKDLLLALPAGCAIELIHTSSLIHDDLPAMDNDDLRRGLPTCHKKFTEATAILAGDALLTHAFNVISQPEPIFKVYPDCGIRLQLISKISQAAGIAGMMEGQMIDMQPQPPLCETNDSLAHLKHMHSLKTGRMITVSLESGGISAGADPEDIHRLTRFGDNMGLAFQVVDDILNVEGDPEKMGKAKGSDAANKKMTYPLIIGMDESKKFAKELLDEAIEFLSPFAEKAAPLTAIAQYIINRDH